MDGKHSGRTLPRTLTVPSRSSTRPSFGFARSGRRHAARSRFLAVTVMLVVGAATVAAWMQLRGPRTVVAGGQLSVAEPVETATLPPQSARGILLEHEPTPLPVASREAVIAISPAPIADPEIAADSRLADPPAPKAEAGNADLAQAIALAKTDPVESRRLLTSAFDSGSLSNAERAQACTLCGELMNSLLLNPKAPTKDPTVRTYTVASGDSLERIVRKQGLSCDWRLVQRMNGLTDPRKIRVGQKLRVPVGTFHAEVIKSQYRLNLYLGEGPGRTLMASLPVGLGTDGGTPLGMFRVRANSKLVDPEWTHPNTGEHFQPNDPKNPIGEWWIGIEGVEDGNREKLGFGIHGTIEPDSIGKDRSLGCVRLLNDDVAIVYATLTEPESTILIKP
jgi:lipoprotein-anchoring transpeptidase ErfK/SrfK